MWEIMIRSRSDGTCHHQGIMMALCDTKKNSVVRNEESHNNWLWGCSCCGTCRHCSDGEPPCVHLHGVGILKLVMHPRYTMKGRSFGLTPSLSPC